jgi:polyphosphate kinase
VFTGSADWMDRNLSRRVEVIFPIEQPDLKARMIDEILKTVLADNVKARELLPDGTYRRMAPGPGDPLVRSQQRFLELAEASARQPLVGPSPSESPIAPRPVRSRKGRTKKAT